MNLRLLATAVAVVSATVLSGAIEAQAARAVVTDTVNVRSGPGTEYRTVGRLHRGDRVEVTRCTQSRRWCHVERRRGRDGWVSSRYLSRVGGGGGHHQGGICFYSAHGYVCLGQ